MSSVTLSVEIRLLVNAYSTYPAFLALITAQNTYIYHRMYNKGANKQVISQRFRNARTGKIKSTLSRFHG